MTKCGKVQEGVNTCNALYSIKQKSNQFVFAAVIHNKIFISWHFTCRVGLGQRWSSNILLELTILLLLVLHYHPHSLRHSGSIELNLSDMVRGAKSASKCTIELAKDWASPRFSVFRAKKMKGWWPLARLKTAEDFEREERERKKAKKKGRKRGRRRKDKWSHMKQEDIEYTDNLGNTYLLMVPKKKNPKITVLLLVLPQSLDMVIMQCWWCSALIGNTILQ